MNKKQQNEKMHKVQKKKKSKRGERSVLLFIGEGQRERKLTTVRVPPFMQLFPDRYDAWCQLDSAAINTAAAGSTYSFMVNNPVYLFGPQVNYTGGFGNNAPSGISYLISGLNDNSALAPYNRYIVLAHTVEVTVNSSGTNTAPFLVGSTYSPNSTATNGMPVSQLPEQERTMFQQVPATTTAGAIRIANSVKLPQMFGFTQSQYLANHTSYGATTGVTPSFQAFNHVWLRSIDGSSTGNYTLLFRHRFHIQFFNLNSFTTAQPTLLESKMPNSKAWF